MEKLLSQKKIELYFDEEKVADIPVNTLVENSPMYDRKWKKAKLPKKNKIKKENLKNFKIIDVLKKVLANPNFIPDAVNMLLLGPGVTYIIKLKSAKFKISSHVITTINL